MKDDSRIVFIVYIVGSRHKDINTAIMHDPHSYMGTVDTLQWDQERENDVWWINHWMNERQWLACSWLLYCSMQGVMYRPCTHMSDHVHLVQSESDMIEYMCGARKCSNLP